MCTSLKEVARRPWGFVPQPSQVTQTMSGCPISVGPQVTQDIWCYTSSSRHRSSGSPACEVSWGTVHQLC